MFRTFFNQFFTKDNPTWFNVLNLAVLSPILIWPFIFYTTIFFFDHPENLGLTYLLFLGVNAYPLYLLIIAYLNSRLFTKKRILGLILPLGILLTFITVGVFTTISMQQNLAKSIEREQEREKQGFIGVNDDYKIIDNKVFRYDTLIDGADAKTFEIIDWQWEKDATTIYHHGKPMKEIDVSTFEYINANYYKDKNNVYYYDEVLVGADPITFEVSPMTHIAKDKNGCYFRGEKTGCKEKQME